MAVWRACQSRPLGIGDFRAWLACHEMLARRCLADQDRAPVFTIDELARLLGVSQKRARESIHRIVDAGLLVWSHQAIHFPEWPLPDESCLEDSLGGGRGSLVIPRRVLRFLAQGAGLALIATTLAVLLRCLSRRRAGWDGRGRVKASWVARVFGVSLRQAKAARMQLVNLGWIEPEDSDQWALNRWGRAYRINLDWAPPQPEAGHPVAPPCPSDSDQGASLTPPPADSGPSLTPPDLQTTIPSGREKNQEPARGPSGFLIEDSGDRDKTLPSPTLADVRLDDLKDTGRLLDLFDQAIDRQLVGSSEADRLKFVALAEHALAIGQGNPPGLFAYLVRGGCWRYITQSDEDRANARIKAYLRGPALVPEPARIRASFAAQGPTLSDDARIVREMRAATIRAGIFRDPQPLMQARDPAWTRERWDRAMAELGM